MMDEDVAGDDPGDGRRWHDMGGRLDRLRSAAIDRDDHDYALWEKRVDALLIITSAKGFFTVDGLRRALEDMGEDAFETRSYYERWVEAVARNLIEAGVVTVAELRAKTEEIAARGVTYGEAAAMDRPAAPPVTGGGDA